MATSTTTNNKSPATALYRGRLMRDINELCKPPCYPNIKLHPPTDNADGKMGHACLLLTTQVYGNVPLHLTVEFPDDYPVRPPRISMDTPGVTHPNIFGRYICASILNTTEGYTSAYTLKSVAIQLLSFFSSDSIEQHGGYVVKLDRYHKDLETKEMRKYVCTRCHYDTHDQRSMLRAAGINLSKMDAAAVKAKNKTVVGAYFADKDEEEAMRKTKKTKMAASKPESKDKKDGGALSALGGRPIDILTDDVLLLILQKLDDTALARFASASKRVKELVEHYDVLRQRELQCFCLKTSYMTSDLGVGVSTRNRSTYKKITESEFDLLSREAFATLNVRRSVQSIEFHHWLPVPLSRRHWLRVRNDVVVALVAIGKDVQPYKKPYYQSEVEEANQHKQGGLSKKQVADLRVPSTVKPTAEGLTQATEVLLSFMTQIVVRLNEDVDKLSSKSSSWDGYGYDDWSGYPLLDTKSSLRFASEKAIESYFHLFHLLVCLAAEHPQVAHDANRRLRSFYVDNKRGKDDCPNLGMLLVALLIADDAVIGVDKEAEAEAEAAEGGGGGPGTREHLAKAIITEAITRNVVWLLDTKGAGRAELVYLEADDTVSPYRLHHTFVGSQTSYRLLMFMELFRKTARPAGQTLEQVRDGLYRRHGAPPPGAAAHLAAEVRRLQTIKEWPDFMQAMGVRVPSQTNFCNVLRKAVRDSMARGYSSWGLTAREALSLRHFHETAFKEGDKWKAPEIPRLEDSEGAGSGRGGRGGRGRGSYRGRDRGRAKFAASKPLSERLDYALKDMATVRFGHGGPKRSSMSSAEREAPEYVKWRIDRREVSFFPDNAAKRAGRKGRQ